MAKSLRSKSKRAFRRIKREDPKSDYAIRDRIRLQRLNEKLKVLTAVERSDDEGEGEGDEELEEQVGAGRQGQDRIVDPEISKGEWACHTSQRLRLLDQSTQLYWLLGVLDQDSLTWASGSKGSMLNVLGRLCTAC